MVRLHNLDSYSKRRGGFTTRVRVCLRTTSSSCTSTSTALEACALVLDFGVALLAFGGAIGGFFCIFSNAFTLLEASLASLFQLLSKPLLPLQRSGNLSGVGK